MDVGFSEAPTQCSNGFQHFLENSNLLLFWFTSDWRAESEWANGNTELCCGTYGHGFGPRPVLGIHDAVVGAEINLKITQVKSVKIRDCPRL